MTALATVWLATELRFDASGRVPQGGTVMKPELAGLVTVTFSDTDPAPFAGTPPKPVTRILSSPPAGIRVLLTCTKPCCSLARVSNSRTGGSEWKSASGLPVGLRASAARGTDVEPLVDPGGNRNHACDDAADVQPANTSPPVTSVATSNTVESGGNGSCPTRTQAPPSGDEVV